MRIYPNQINDLKDLLLTNKAQIVYVYGADLGLIELIVQRIKDFLQHYELIECSTDEELSNICFVQNNLFTDKKLIICNDFIPNKNIITRIVHNLFIIAIIKENIDIKIRNFYEKSSQIVLLPCFANKNLSHFIKQYLFIYHEIQIEQQAIDHLIEYSYIDRKLLITELDKLGCNSKNYITYKDVVSADIFDYSNKLYELVIALFDNNTQQYFHILKYLKRIGNKDEVIIKFITEYIIKILYAKTLGMDKVNVHFQFLKAFESNVHHNSEELLLRMLAYLNKVEVLMKNYGIDTALANLIMIK